MRNSATALSVCVLFALALVGCGGGGGKDLSLHGAQVQHTPANTAETPTTKTTTNVSIGGNMVVSNAEGVLNSSGVKLSVQVPDLCVDSSKGCTQPQVIDHDSFFRQQDGTTTQYIRWIRVFEEDHAEHRPDEGTIGEGPLAGWVVSRIGKNRYPGKGTDSQKDPVDVFHYSVAAKSNGGNDYTSFGYWAYEIQIQETALGGTVISRVTGDAFAGGTNRATNISRVGGEATYQGEAAGYVTWRYATAARGLGLATFDGVPVEMVVDLDGVDPDDESGSYVSIDMSEAKWQYAHHHASDENELNARFPAYSEEEDEDGLVLYYDETSGGLNFANDGTFTTAYKTGNRYGNINESENESENMQQPPHQATDSRLQGRFYGPNGDDFPQQAAGTFYFERDTGTRTEYYRIDGAFGAER